MFETQLTVQSSTEEAYQTRGRPAVMGLTWTQQLANRCECSWRPMLYCLVGKGGTRVQEAAVV